MFEPYLSLWKLTPEGDPLVTHSSRLLPVRAAGQPAMLKVAVAPEERYGARLMQWWRGEGAARVLARHGAGLLLERADGGRSLAEMARQGDDDEACRILCRVTAQLHAPRRRAALPARALTTWFRDLEPAAAAHGGILSDCWATARQLLRAPQDEVTLHGDIHHGNVLDFGPRGWLAIDPKRLGGERGFDYANLFSNPERATALRPGRLARRAVVVAEAAGLERARLLRWVVAQAGLSAAWSLRAGMPLDGALSAAAEAWAELHR